MAQPGNSVPRLAGAWCLLATASEHTHGLIAGSGRLGRVSYWGGKGYSWMGAPEGQTFAHSPQSVHFSASIW